MNGYIQVIRRVFDDRGDMQIGLDLGISVHTVHAHLRRIFEKTGAHSRVELVVVVLSAVRRG